MPYSAGAIIVHAASIPMKTYTIATIPGDGIGKEVIPAGREVLEKLAAASARFGFDFENFDWGSDHYRAHGAMMPDDARPDCATRMPSSSARQATRTFRITSRCGACG
jgi:isocitrate dehydrogenase